MKRTAEVAELGRALFNQSYHIKESVGMYVRLTGSDQPGFETYFHDIKSLSNFDGVYNAWYEYLTFLTKKAVDPSHKARSLGFDIVDLNETLGINLSLLKSIMSYNACVNALSRLYQYAAYLKTFQIPGHELTKILSHPYSYKALEFLIDYLKDVYQENVNNKIYNDIRHIPMKSSFTGEFDFTLDQMIVIIGIRYSKVCMHAFSQLTLKFSVINAKRPTDKITASHLYRLLVVKSSRPALLDAFASIFENQAIVNAFSVDELVNIAATHNGEKNLEQLKASHITLRSYGLEAREVSNLLSGQYGDEHGLAIDVYSPPLMAAGFTMQQLFRVLKSNVRCGYSKILFLDKLVKNIAQKHQVPTSQVKLATDICFSICAKLTSKENMQESINYVVSHVMQIQRDRLISNQPLETQHAEARGSAPPVYFAYQSAPLPPVPPVIEPKKQEEQSQTAVLQHPVNPVNQPQPFEEEPFMFFAYGSNPANDEPVHPLLGESVLDDDPDWIEAGREVMKW